MFVTQDILFGVASQTLHLDAPEGRPSSVSSVSVFEASTGDTGTAESATTGSPAVETNPNTTVNADSGDGQTNPNVLNVAATTGFAADRRYLVTAALGFKEWIEVVEISGGVSVTARHPLMGAYVNGDTVQSTRMAVTVDPTWVADAANLSHSGDVNPRYRVRWVYVVNSVTYVRDTYFDLVRYVGDHDVEPQDVDRLSPGWMDRLPVDHRKDQGRALIDDAYAEVRLDLAAADVNDSALADQTAVNELVRRKRIAMTEYARFLSDADRQAQYQAARLEYTSMLDAFVRVVRRAPTRDSTGAAAVDLAVPISVR